MGGKMQRRRIFWLILFLIAAFAIHYRQAGFNVVNLGYKFGRLHLIKQKVFEIKAGQDTIRIYIESYPQPINLVNSDQLGVIFKEAYSDYYFFLQEHYPQIFHDRVNGFNKKAEVFDFIFVSSSTYEPIDKIIRHDTAAHLGFSNTVYLKTHDGFNSRNLHYLVVGLKPVIRHEIFHCLNNSYGLADEFEESAAQKFGVN